MGQKLSKTRWQGGTVLEPGSEARQLWVFAAGKKGFTLSQEETVPAAQPLPEKLVAKDWKTLFQPKLNIALLPPGKVFLRVIQLPAGPLDETVSMVELQLEKLSPLPVPQIVWSIQVLPQTGDNLQTVIVAMVARELVDQQVGELERQGYLPDRLEVPMIDQLQATPITGDGAWIYPEESADKFTGIVAWWYGGVLRNVGLLHVPAAQNRGELLEEQLKQMTWSGELDGWLTSPPRWHLVATETVARLWQPLFFSWLGHEVDVEAPLPPADAATLTANRAARSDGGTSLLPAEYTRRYHQEFVDRLWIRGLGSLLAVYVLGVVIYFAALEVQDYRTGKVETAVRGLSTTYTNTLQMRAKMEVLQTRQALKYASLDCWKATAELLPESLTLQTLEFDGEKKTLRISGSAPADQGNQVLSFSEAMKKASLPDGQLLFENVEVPARTLNPDRATLNWHFSCDLRRGETQ